MEVDIARCQWRIEDPVAKRLWRKLCTVKSSIIDVWQGSKHASGLWMSEKTHFLEILKYNKQVEGWYSTIMEEITFNLWRNQTHKYLKTPNIFYKFQFLNNISPCISPHTLSLHSFLRFSYELYFYQLLFFLRWLLYLQTFCFLCNVFHNTHQTRCYHLFIILNCCWKCQFDTDVKIEIYNHHDGNNNLFLKKFIFVKKSRCY